MATDIQWLPMRRQYKECFTLAQCTDRPSQFKMASVWSKMLKWWQGALTSTGYIYSWCETIWVPLPTTKIQKTNPLCSSRDPYAIIFSIHPMHELCFGRGSASHVKVQLAWGKTSVPWQPIYFKMTICPGTYSKCDTQGLNLTTKKYR